MDMTSVVNFFDRIIPITHFNQGKANQIFDDVSKKGTSFVFKHNAPVCVLMSPEEYKTLLELKDDLILELEARDRMAQHDPSECISQSEIMEKYHITDTDLDTTEIEFD